MPARDIVVIGGSSGALEALRAIVIGLPADFPAAIFVTLHTSPEGPGLLPQIIRRISRLESRFPSDRESFRRGCVYVAPPDRHLLVKRDYVRVTRGPRENRFRPAVDPLFRTAAVAHRNRVIGIVLSGGQDDGAVGAGIIKSVGGIVIVQDPSEAMATGMPEAAIRHVNVDHIAPGREIAALLDMLTREPLEEMEAVMAEDIPEDIAEVGGHKIHHAKELGPPSPFTCPDCGGTLWQSQDGDLFQFQCHVGHRYSGDSLVSADCGRSRRAPSCAGAWRSTRAGGAWRSSPAATTIRPRTVSCAPRSSGGCSCLSGTGARNSHRRIPWRLRPGRAHRA
jgi:two-component system chemotaxis response regulator CheB